MSNYLLSSSDKSRKIAKLSISTLYTFNPRKSLTEKIKIKKVSIYDDAKAREIITRKYMIKYQQLLKIIQDLIASDSDNEGDFMICLDELTKLKEILIYKYQNFLKKELYEAFLEKLLFLEKMLNEKILEYREQILYDETMGGR